MKTAYFLFFAISLVGCVGTSKNLHISESSTDTAPRMYPLEESEWSESARQALQPVLRDNDTFNVFKVIAHNPELLHAWNPLGLYLLRDSNLPARDREILILKTAALAGSDYEFSQHAVIGKFAGLSESEIQAIVRNENPDTWEEFELSLLTAATELNTSNTISDRTWSALSKRYDKKQLLDLIATVGQYRGLAMLLNALKVPIDEGIPHIKIAPQAD